MKLLVALMLGLGLTATYAEETKDIKVNGKTLEARVPKSAHVNCKDAANKEKTECKKQAKEMPKVEKPKETAPADATAKKK